MKKSALLHDQIRPGEPGWVDRLLAYHRSWAGRSVMENDPDPKDPDPKDPPKPDPKPDPDPKDPGFPANTPIAEMTEQQQVAYWKDKARKHEERAASRADYDDLKAKAEKFDKAQRDAETEHEKALREAREQAKEEGRKEALSESSNTTVKALLEGALKARGVEDTDSIVKHLTFSSFVTDGQIDHDAITSYADRNSGATAGGGGRGGRGPDTGAGRRGQGASTKGVAAGADLFAATRGGKKKSTDNS